MTKDQIYDLLELLPAGVSLHGELAAPVSGNPQTRFREHEQRMLRYAAAYADLQFGWRYVQVLLNNNIEFTPLMREIAGPEIVATYDYFACDTREPAVMDAWMIAASRERVFDRRVVEALLVSKSYDVEQVQKLTGLGSDAIAAYEKLFFNIIDRRKESLFIASVVYPNSRIVEMCEGYMNEPENHFGKILQRSGFNNGLPDLLYLSGHAEGNGLLSQLATRETAGLLELTLMANAYILARNGWINQHTHGITQARGLIAAGKAGGDNNDPSLDSPFATLGSTLQQELVSCKRAEAERSLAHARRVPEMAPTGAKTSSN